MNECVFCEIINGKISTTIVYEDEFVIAFEDILPAAPHHILIVPKKHIQNIIKLQAEKSEILSHILSKVVPKIVSKLGITDAGFRIVINTGVDGGQTIDHLHIHLLGGRKMTWPPG